MANSWPINKCRIGNFYKKITAFTDRDSYIRNVLPIHCLADFCADHTDHVYYVKNHRSMVLRSTVL